jgi:hypothetical protein
MKCYTGPCVFVFFGVTYSMEKWTLGLELGMSRVYTSGYWKTVARKLSKYKFLECRR